MTSTTTVEPKRVIVIGAGLAGLVAAKTYLEVDPNIKLTIIDSEQTVGGVWTKDKCFPGVLGNSPTSLFDFSDIAMRDVIGWKDWFDLPDDKVYKYLHFYADKFSLLERLRLNTRVSKVFRNGDGEAWDIEIAGSNKLLTCDKLIISSGLHSKAQWPDISTRDFTGFAIHSKDIGLHYHNLTSEKVKRVTIYGGCKSAVNAILLCVNTGKKVDWVIRESENEAATIIDFQNYGVNPARPTGRWKNIFTPSILKTHTSKSLNSEKLGLETENGLLFNAGFPRPHRTAAAEKFIKELYFGSLIQVHRATIISMLQSEITLSNGEVFPSDAAIFTTRYQSQPTLFTPADGLALGVNFSLTEETLENANYLADMGSKAEKDVLKKHPILRSPPPYHKKEVTHMPYRLYRNIVPSSLAAQKDRSLVFLGCLADVQTTLYTEVAALWAVAWLDGLLDLPTSKEAMDHNIAMMSAWSRHRYLSRDRVRQIASSEIYTNLLMRDMSLDVCRSGNFFKERFAQSRPQRYKGIVQEFLAKKRGVAKNRKAEADQIY